MCVFDEYSLKKMTVVAESRQYHLKSDQDGNIKNYHIIIVKNRKPPNCSFICDYN